MPDQSKKLLKWGIGLFIGFSVLSVGTGLALESQGVERCGDFQYCSIETGEQLDLGEKPSPTPEPVDMSATAALNTYGAESVLDEVAMMLWPNMDAEQREFSVKSICEVEEFGDSEWNYERVSDAWNAEAGWLHTSTYLYEYEVPSETEWWAITMEGCK